MREGPSEVTQPSRTACPHCREPVDAMAHVCPHCRRDTTVDLLLDAPIADQRQRYRLAKALVDWSPQLRFGGWVRRLARGGAILRGAPRGLAESVRQQLGVAGQGASIRLHQPGGHAGGLRWALGGGAALIVLLAVFVIAGVLAKRMAPRTDGAAKAPPVTQAAVPARGPQPPTPREVAAAILPSVVVLRCEQQSGSGFFVTPHRVLTNQHVTCGAEGTLDVELADGTKGKGRVVAADPRLDLAVVETALGGTPLPTASAGDLATGDTVMAAGAPLGLERSFHVGTLSNTRRILLGVCHLQIDAAINPGNSGGPLLDAQGHVVAVVSMKRDQAEGIAFAVPIDYAFDGDAPLLPAPAGHPTRGFRSMQEAARHDDERLREESRRLRMQVVRAVPSGRAQVLAVVLSASQGEPEQLLSFHFEQQERTICSVTGTVSWQENHPDEGLAKRASDWMERAGIGRVYSGFVLLDVRACAFERGLPIALILEEGDESINWVTL